MPEPDAYYRDAVSTPFKGVTAAAPGVLRDLTLYGQVRGIIGGATTMVVDADLDPNAPADLPGFVRDPGNWPGRVWGVLDVGCIESTPPPAGDSPSPDTRSMLERILDDLQVGAAKLLVHAGEGVDDFSRGEFLSLHLKGLLTPHTAIIHALALLDADWQLMRVRGTSVIWSPRSNFRLYGRSIDIGQVLGAGVRVALAPDWTITGSSTILDELAFVRGRYSWIDDEALLAMVTSSAADLMGMPRLGRLAPGTMADLLVFARDGAADRRSAATRVVTATPADLQLALVGGAAVYGVPDLVARFPAAGVTTESIAVPLPDGTSAARALRVGGPGSFGDALRAITTALAGQSLTPAPLWEPD